MQQPTKRSIRTTLVVTTTVGAVLALAGATSAATPAAAKAREVAKSNAKAKGSTKPNRLTRPDLRGAGGKGDDEGGSSGQREGGAFGQRSTPITPGTTTLGAAARSRSGKHKLSKPVLGGSGSDD